MKHWCDTWPHKIKATVVLYCGIVINFKIGQRGFEDYWFDKGVTTKQKTFEVWDNDEHNKVFEVDAIKFIRQWPISARMEKALGPDPLFKNIN